MRIGVLGTGMVGQAIATRLCELQHEVCMGSRTADNAAATQWAAHHGPTGRAGTFADAADFGAIVFNATSGAAAVEVAAGVSEFLAGKVLIDVSNPVDHSGGQTTLLVGNTDSLAEGIQRAVPGARIVKTLNTVNCEVMVNPQLVPGEHAMFVSGDDVEAKAVARLFLDQFGWPAERIIDLGDLTGARAQEAYLLLWVRLMGPLGGFRFNVAIEQGAAD